MTLRAADPLRDRSRRRQRWLNVLLLLLVVPMIAMAALRLGPLVGAPVRVLLKTTALALPLLAVLVVLARLRRR